MYCNGKKTGTIRFGFKPAAGVRQVSLAGDFNRWKPSPLVRLKDGSLGLEVAMSRGIHQYKFIVDGQWVADPDNSQRAVSPLGTVNSLIKVM